MQGAAPARPVLGQTCIQRGLFYKKKTSKNILFLIKPLPKDIVTVLHLFNSAICLL